MKALNEIVRQLVMENGFRAAVLTNASGLPLVAFPEGSEAEAPAAMVALVQRVFEQVRGRVGLRTMDEIALRDEAGQQLVCRRVSAGQHELVLAVLIPPRRDYRQATSWAVQQIQQAWSAAPDQARM